jgi:nitronate monooxygenase
MSRPVLRTPLCDRLGIEYPIFLAGMGAGNQGGAAGPELVAAVSEAGGLGVLGGTGHNIDEFHDKIAQTRRLTKKPFGVDVLLPSAPDGREPNGAARPTIDRRYVEWVEKTLEENNLTASAARSAPGAFTLGSNVEQKIEAILEEKPAVFAAGLGSPGPYVQRLHAAGISVFGLVGNVKTARRVKTDGADVIVAQGYEAGGHTGRIGTFALVPQVVDAVSPTPVVLAGGVGDGRGVAAALALGAQAVWVGTAFLATPEANIRPEHKRHLLESTEEDTRVTRLYSGKTARALVNPVIQSWENSGLPALPMGLQGQVSGRIEAAARASDRHDLSMHLGGQIAGIVHEIRPAHVVLDEMVREAVDVLTTLTRTRVTVSMG